MPVTRSELLFFSAGVAAGALVHANFPKIKEALGPFVAGAMNGAAGTGTGTGTLGDRCAEIVRAFAEKIEAVQDAMSEMSQTAATAAAAGATAATSDAASASGSSSASASSPHGRFEGVSQSA